MKKERFLGLGLKKGGFLGLGGFPDVLNELSRIFFFGKIIDCDMFGWRENEDWIDDGSGKMI